MNSSFIRIWSAFLFCFVFLFFFFFCNLKVVNMLMPCLVEQEVEGKNMRWNFLNLCVT